jgi:hypothetical protein
MGFYRSKSVAIYVLWKAVEVKFPVAAGYNTEAIPPKISCRELHSAGLLPSFPLAVELLYAISTGVLFHLGVNEPHHLKPSYLVFMNKITGNR